MSNKICANCTNYLKSATVSVIANGQPGTVDATDVCIVAVDSIATEDTVSGAPVIDSAKLGETLCRKLNDGKCDKFKDSGKPVEVPTSAAKAKP